MNKKEIVNNKQAVDEFIKIAKKFGINIEFQKADGEDIILLKTRDYDLLQQWEYFFDGVKLGREQVI